MPADPWMCISIDGEFDGASRKIYTIPARGVNLWGCAKKTGIFSDHAPVGVSQTFLCVDGFWWCDGKGTRKLHGAHFDVYIVGVLWSMPVSYGVTTAEICHFFGIFVVERLVVVHAMVIDDGRSGGGWGKMILFAVENFFRKWLKTV